ncbi:MAG: carboxypeptidase regulatory-like domain-containing protein, partial [Elusimicrobiota bacterium]
KQWTKVFGTTDDDTSSALTLDSSGNVYLNCTASKSYDSQPFSGITDLLLLKFNSSGTKQWARMVGSADTEISGGITTDSAGNVYASGTTGIPPEAPIDGEPAQKLASSKQRAAMTYSVYGTTPGIDGNLGSGALDIFFSKFDSAGTKQWTKQFGTSENDNADDIAVDTGNNIYLSGGTGGALDGNINTGLTDVIITKYGYVYYYIKGYVRDNTSTGISGVTLTLSGTGTGSYSTDSTGYYEFLNLPSGSYGITATKTDYGFNPSSKTFTALSSNQENQNFTGTYTPTVFSIKGYIRNTGGTAIPGLSVTLSGDANKTAITTATGYYEFTNLNTGNYLLKPTGTNWTFSPVSKTFLSLSANQETQNFTGTCYGYFTGKTSSTLNGTNLIGVMVETQISGITINSTLTDTSGNYVLRVPTGTYDLKASSTGYTTSTRASMTTLYNSTTTVNFGLTKTLFYIKGYARDNTATGITGVTVNLTGTSTGSYTTTGTGYYEFLNIPSGNYAVTAGKTGYTFSPSNKSYTNLSASQDTQNFTGTIAGITYYIRGYTRTSGSTAISGVTINLTGSNTGSTITDNSGYYEFPALTAGNYAVIPLKTDYNFSPSSKTYSSITANQDTQNYIGTYNPVTYNINGYVRTVSSTGVTGITLRLTPSTWTYTTTSTGYYQFTGIISGMNYTLTPDGILWEFDPANKTYNPLTANQANQNFTAVNTTITQTGYYIKGYIRDSATSTGISSVTIRLTDSSTGTYTTSDTGYYEFLGLTSGNYTLTPGKQSYSFSPGKKTYTALTGNQENQTFTGTYSTIIYRITGYVRTSNNTAVTGVTLTLTGSNSGTASTDNTGYYEFTNLLPGNYYVILTKPSYFFTPSNRAYTPLEGNSDTQNYTATYSTVTYTIKGYVLDGQSAAVDSAVVTLTGTVNGTYTTNSEGYYEFRTLPPGNYDVTAVKQGYDITPSTRSYAPLSANQVNQYFIAAVTPDSAPEITMLNPTPGQIIWGTTKITVSVTDDKGIAQVLFYGAKKLLTIINTPPWECYWDTTKTKDGNSTVEAIVYDTVNHTANKRIVVNINNAAYNDTLATDGEVKIKNNFVTSSAPLMTVLYNPRESDVVTEIYDFTGRRIKLIYNGKNTGDTMEFQWDATDDNGTKVNSGTYVIVITDGTAVITRKVVVLR